MATAHDHAAMAEQVLAMADAPGLPTQSMDRLIAVAQVHVELAKVRLELERRAAENAATDRLLADQLGSLDDYCFCNPKPGESTKHDTDCPHNKKASTVAPAKASE